MCPRRRDALLDGAPGRDRRRRRRRTPSSSGLTFAYVYGGDQPGALSVYLPGDPRVELLTGLGLQLAPSVSTLTSSPGTFVATLGLENADQLNDAQLLFTWFNDADEQAATEAQPLWAQIPAFASGAYVPMLDTQLGMAVSVATPLSVPWALDEYLPLITAGAAKARPDLPYRAPVSTAVARAPHATRVRGSRALVLGLGLVAAVLLLVLVVGLSIAVGAKPVPLGDVWSAWRHPDGSFVSTVVASRIPRTQLGLLVGAALAVAGVVIQGLTRNPLGRPRPARRQRRGVGVPGGHGRGARRRGRPVRVGGGPGGAARGGRGLPDRVRGPTRHARAARAGGRGRLRGAGGGRRGDHAGQPRGVRHLPVLGGRVAGRAAAVDRRTRCSRSSWWGSAVPAAGAAAERARARRRGRDLPRAARRPHPPARRRGRHRAVRRRGRRRRAHRVRRARRAARRARVHRLGPPLAPAVLPRCSARCSCSPPTSSGGSWPGPASCRSAR